MSVSRLAKPSDDRKANSCLAGWNISSLIQGTTMLGMPYAVQLGGWATVGAIFFIGFLSCYTGMTFRLRLLITEFGEIDPPLNGVSSENWIGNSV